MNDSEVIRIFNKWVDFIGSKSDLYLDETDSFKLYTSLRNTQFLISNLKSENETLTTNHKHHKGKHCFLNHTLLHIIVHLAFHLVLHGVLEHFIH